jgi:hypothetical protein
MSSSLLSSEKDNERQLDRLPTNADRIFIDLYANTHKEDQWPGLMIEERKVFDLSFDDRKEHIVFI